MVIDLEKHHGRWERRAEEALNSVFRHSYGLVSEKGKYSFSCMYFLLCATGLLANVFLVYQNKSFKMLLLHGNYCGV